MRLFHANHIQPATGNRSAYKGASDEVLHTIQATAFLDIVADVPVPAQIAAWRLGAGESAVLAQAVHNPNSLAVLDDREGRRCADQVGVPRIGTLGVIVLAKQSGIIPLAGPVIETVMAHGLFVSRPVLDMVFALAGETRAS